jgi:hypothetical protein
MLAEGTERFVLLRHEANPLYGVAGTVLGQFLIRT